MSYEKPQVLPLDPSGPGGDAAPQGCTFLAVVLAVVAAAAGAYVGVGYAYVAGAALYAGAAAWYVKVGSKC